MVNIIVAFPRAEDGRNMKSILMRNGFQVTAVCTTGAQAINQADALNDGIVVCGYRIQDMLYAELYENLPERFEMLLLTSRLHLNEEKPQGVICVPMPLKVVELVNTLSMMSEGLERQRRKRHQRPAVRNEEDQADIRMAKEILMERHGMTEGEAHRYIQKCSMDSGNSMAETARMIISIKNNS